MSFCADIRRHRLSLAESGLAFARELEAGRAQTPFQDKLRQLSELEPRLPVRAAVIAATPEETHGLLSEIAGADYNVCKIVVPSRLGYSEVMLQERGFLLDTGNGPREFDEVGGFLSALQQAHVLRADDDAGFEPLRMKLKGPAHLSGLCLLVPHGLDALVRRPALLSTLTDQADWVFLAGTNRTMLSDEQRQMIQLVLDHVTGLQNVLQPGPNGDGSTPPADPWWKGWKVGLSLGLVPLGTDLLRSRLALLTGPESELRLYLVESRLLRQLDTALTLMVEEVQQAQRQAANRLALAREGLLKSTDRGSELRKASEALRSRLSEEIDSVVKAVERETRATLAADGDIALRLKVAAQEITADDIEQTPAEVAIKLTIGADLSQRLVRLVSQIGRERLLHDHGQIREGVECSLRDAERSLEEVTGFRHRLTLDLPDEETLWQSVGTLARPEIRYRSEMPRPTFATRLQAARQVIMSLMIGGMILGGVATLTGGEGGGARQILYAFMLPLLIIGFLWTYVSFRKKERHTLEKEVEKLQDGVGQELRRVLQDLVREQQSLIQTALQKGLRQTQQQMVAAIEKVDQLQRREAEENARRQAEQQRSLDQRISRLRQLGQQVTSLHARLAEGRNLQRRWLADWIDRFNQGKA